MNENIIDGVCHVFGAAPLSSYGIMKVIKKKNDTVICADGGYDRALHFGITPDWIVGDFDSKESVDLIPNVIRVKPEKDETDMQLAVNHGISLGYARFIIYGGLGGRFDHSIANLQLLAEIRSKGCFGMLCDEQNEVFLLKNDCLDIQATEHKYISVFSFSERCEGVTLSGVKYPLTDYTLTNTSGGLGTSNEILGEKATIKVSSGTLIIMRTKD